MEITDEMRAAVQTALVWPTPDKIIAAVAPLIRAAALEEAAKVCDVTPLSDGCAKSIRALATQEG